MKPPGCKLFSGSAFASYQDCTRWKRRQSSDLLFQVQERVTDSDEVGRASKLGKRISEQDSANRGNRLRGQLLELPTPSFRIMIWFGRLDLNKTNQRVSVQEWRTKYRAAACEEGVSGRVCAAFVLRGRHLQQFLVWLFVPGLPLPDAVF